jgi:hypothetical protein
MRGNLRRGRLVVRRAKITPGKPRRPKDDALRRDHRKCAAALSNGARLRKVAIPAPLQ